MGSIEEETEQKLNNIIQRTDTLEAESSGGADAPSTPPPPPRKTLNSFKGPKKAHQTQCTICNKYFTEIDEHLTGGKSQCSKMIENLGYDLDAEISAPVESAVVPHFGIAVCCAVLEGFEDWLKPEYVQLTQDWQDKASAAIQQIAEERIGNVIQSPGVILLVCFSQLVRINKDAIRRKLKGEKLPDNSDLPDGFKAGSPSTGVRGDSGNGEDFNGQGIS